MITLWSISRNPQVNFLLILHDFFHIYLKHEISHKYFLVQFSVRENLLVVTGNPETKDLKAMLPEGLKQFGPHQLNYLKNIVGGAGDAVKESSKAEEDEDDVPDLVGTNFEEASKKE